MYLLNLHTTPKGHLIKNGTFLQKSDSYSEKYTFARRFEWLKLIKFLEILNSNKTPNIFSTYQLKITFKPLNVVRKPFLLCFKIRTPLGLKHLNFRIFSFIFRDRSAISLHLLIYITPVELKVKFSPDYLHL